MISGGMVNEHNQEESRPITRRWLVEQSPSWVTNGHSTIQESSILLWNPKIYYCVHNSLPLDSLLSHMNPVQPILLIYILIFSSMYV
jgi:hypothetical protein